MIMSWTDIRDAEIIIREDCDFRFNIRRSDAVRIIVDIEEASCAGLSDEDVGISA